ncbi:hypothetical protein [Microlunatus sp. GCM10028923]|uniref:hypothetical protein n=1 Tax=Microlunatus sp. GCM10028923 TaxID=3273400 RepID=UPI00361172EE
MSKQAMIDRPATPTGGARWRTGALAAAVVLAVLAAVVQSRGFTGPAVTGLLAGDAVGEAKEGLRMMGFAMAVVAWTYPIMLILTRRLTVPGRRAALTMIMVLNASFAISWVGAGLLLGGAGPFWVLPGVVAVLAWLARPPRPERMPMDRPVRSRGRLVIFWFTAALATVTTLFHVGWATVQSWPAQLLASNTAPPQRAEFAAIWLFSCVLFASVATVLILSLRLPADSGRPLVRYAAALVAVIAITRTVTMIMGLGPDHQPAEPIIAGTMAVLIFLSAPPVR